MPKAPLSSSSFSLDSSGVAGFFGGDEAVSAMATVHVYEGRKWLGWYNSPGAYEVAKKYGQLARSRFWDGLFPGPNVDPATMFELDGMQGPRYMGAHSGTVIEHTGHLGRLFELECEELEPVEIKGRTTTPVGVSIAQLTHEPEGLTYPRLLRTHSSLLACIPISASVGACAVAAVFQDYYIFSMILLGIMASGLSCFVIGSGKFTFDHPVAALGVPDGDGIIMGQKGVILLKGTENAVNPITRGKFSLRFESEPDYKNIGLCSLLLTIQFVAQLLLIPQGTLFGQILFLGSLGVSWGYSLYLSSFDREKIQRRILVEHVLQRPSMRKYSLGTRTTMAVFVLLVLRPAKIAKQLDDIIPNDTKVWRIWKETIIGKIERGESFANAMDDIEQGDMDGTEFGLLHILFGDAVTAEKAYEIDLERAREFQKRSPTLLSSISSTKSDFAIA